MKKLYNARTIHEFPTTYEIILKLQEIHDKRLENHCDLQAKVSSEDIVSIEVLTDSNIDLVNVESYLMNSLDKEQHEEIGLLIAVLKQSVKDNLDELYLYNS